MISRKFVKAEEETTKEVTKTKGKGKKGEEGEKT
jgi:hypothetical protein